MKKILFLLVGLLTSVSLFAYDDFDIIEGTAPISLPTEALIVNNQPILCDRMTWGKSMILASWVRRCG